MQEDGNRYFTINGGISLILLVFVILSMVSFAALSLSTAMADARITEKYIQKTQDYYDARNEAQKWLARLDETGAAEYTGSLLPDDASKDPAAQDAKEQPGSDQPDPVITRDSDDPAIITARFDAGDTQQLVVTVQLSNLSGTAQAVRDDNDENTEKKASGELTGHCYKALSEKIESTIVYEYDESLPVMR